MQSVFVDQEVVAQILGVIDQAKQNVVLVSPYLDLWQHAKNAIDRAIKRGVAVQMFL
jgi:sugar-specific transcriptional regulator TrmB